MHIAYKITHRCCTALSLLLLICLVGAPVLFAQESTSGTVKRTANLRAGPGTNYAIVGQAVAGQTLTIIDQNPAGDWYQLADGVWIAAFLVEVAAADASSRAAVATAPAVSLATANRAANLRAGPGTNYPIVGTVAAGQPLTITASNSDVSWLQLSTNAWIAAFLVSQPGATPLAASAVPTATATPASSGNDFILIEKRLWNPIENGGALDGPSVHCGQGRQLVVTVLDAAGNRLNGVAVQAQYGAREIIVTGAQGKGDGVAEFVLGGGQDVKVIRDAAGRPVSSDLAADLSTHADNIPYPTLISAQYCQDETTCQKFVQNNSCYGHFSWSVLFQRRS
jgi:uncharacterized protein YraI